MKLEGKIAVVTGASRGIGQEIAVRLAAEGASVACIATKAENAAGTVERIVEGKGVAHAYGLNVADREAVENVFAQITEEIGVPTLLVNCAGITRDTLMMRMTDEDWDAVIATNLTGSYNCIRAVIRGMMKAREGRIVNLTSVIGLHGGAGQANYSASKAGLVGLTMSVAKELGSRNITCNAVAPGFIATDMTAELSDEMKENVVKTAPLGRLGDPGDIAGVVAFLLSEDARYMTGQVLTVDGGLTL